MSRAIKFRAWSGERLISPDYIDRSGRANWKENGISESTNRVMQASGELDINQIEAYEDDIVRVTYSWHSGYDSNEMEIWNTEQIVARVMFKDAAFIFETVDPVALINGIHISCEDFPFEIIGNIYENPELI